MLHLAVTYMWVYIFELSINYMQNQYIPIENKINCQLP